MGRGDQVGGVRRSLGVSESLLRQSLLEIDTATFARMVSRGLLHGKTFLSRPLTVRIYFKFSVTQFDNVLWGGVWSKRGARRGRARARWQSGHPTPPWRGSWRGRRPEGRGRGNRAATRRASRRRQLVWRVRRRVPLAVSQNIVGHPPRGRPWRRRRPVESEARWAARGVWPTAASGSAGATRSAAGGASCPPVSAARATGPTSKRDSTSASDLRCAGPLSAWNRRLLGPGRPEDVGDTCVAWEIFSWLACPTTARVSRPPRAAPLARACPPSIKNPRKWRRRIVVRAAAWLVRQVRPPHAIRLETQNNTVGLNNCQMCFVS